MDDSRTLLLVDDEILILEILQEALAPLEAKILLASDGAQALEILKAAKPDAVVSDIHMPGLSGFDFIKKAREASIHTPFVFMTGYGDKEKAVTALRLGAFDFLEKPFKAPQLREVVDRALHLGVELRSLEYEVDNQVRGSDIPSSEISQFREIVRKVLALKKANKVRKAG
ncbi:MAG: hypothetical protein A2X94_14920 [Bdellovibrionales bacterium GWB1_55_8]|nr:MAG: hypothetical protein A2X94_14920 [Bdellovibrionales bacterium GWB1_55_8]